MNIKRILSFSLLILLLGANAYAQMTDAQVLATIKRGLSAGKSKSQIGTELISQGATSTQIKRLMQTYGVSSSDIMSSSSSSSSLLDSRLNSRRSQGQTGVDRMRGKRTKDTDKMGFDGLYDADSLDYERRNPYGYEEDGLLDERMQPRSAKNLKNAYRDDLTDLQMAERDMDALPGEAVLDEDGKPVMPKRIFGHDMFRSRRLSFEPNENTATPASYTLGPGDEVIIDIWGLNEATISSKISPDGLVYIEQIGPVALSGLTISQATSKLRSTLSRKYSLSGENPQSHMSLTLGNIRTIMVNVLGEVKTPGTYRLSAFSTVLNALYRAGGITQIGSLRAVQVVRGGKIVATADIYKLIFDGKSPCSVSLKDGDAIIVPPYTGLVEVKGGLKRPMYYEVIPGEAAANVIKYAGGFTSDAETSMLSIERKDGEEASVKLVKDVDFNVFALQDGDRVSAYRNLQKNNFTNKVEVKGAVLRPGVYALGGDVATVRQLVSVAGGLLDDAFMGRAQIFRENEDRSYRMLAVNLGGIMKGTEDDVALRRNDILFVGNTNKMNVKGDVSILGYVQYPGDYVFAEGMTVEDLIMLAGGLRSGASSAIVGVSRRIVDPASMQASDTLSYVYNFSFKDGLVVEGDPSFTLQPYDVVAVRKSPTYVEQKKVRISGEVNFPGDYTLTTNDERLSDLFKRAGGLTPNGYVAGAMLRRKFSKDELNVRKTLRNIAKKGNFSRNDSDSLKLEKVSLSDRYTIGIDLAKAISRPHSDEDVVLRDGDELIVPSMTNTVRVQGEVLYPNSVGYIAGKSVSYYVDQAGGFSTDAKRGKVYVVHMNGKVSVGLGAKVQPGCEIVVPSRPERHKTTIAEWLGIGTTAASITTMVATIANLMKK